MRKNIIDKIWSSHVIASEKNYPDVFAIDVMLLHEVTSAQAFQFLEEKKIGLLQKERLFATLDHSIPTSKDQNFLPDPIAKKQVAELRKNVKKHNISFFDIASGKQGIVHVIGPEQGITQPGLTLVCGDSHTSTHGAFGALAFGIGTSEVAHVLATGSILQKKPKTLKVEFTGIPGPGISPKDVILKLISQIGIDGANGHVIEYTGEWVRSLSMEGRMTLCNMSIECGARAGLIAPDEITFSYLQGKPYAPKGSQWELARKAWEGLKSDPDCSYDQEISCSIETLQAMVTWGTNPGQAVEIDQIIPQNTDTSAQTALNYMDLEAGQKIRNTAIQWAFLGSCTNGRIEDLRIAASILRDKKVHSGVKFYIVPGSEQVKKQAEEENLDKIFIESGAVFRNPGCSMCLGMNEDKVPQGERCISSSNRNFVGRQGKGSRTHLASPATVTASAVAGYITNAHQA